MKLYQEKVHRNLLIIFVVATLVLSLIGFCSNKIFESAKFHNAESRLISSTIPSIGRADNEVMSPVDMLDLEKRFSWKKFALGGGAGVSLGFITLGTLGMKATCNIKSITESFGRGGWWCIALAFTWLIGTLFIMV